MQAEAKAYPLLQDDFLKYISETLGTEPWVKVYESAGSLSGLGGRHCFFSAFIPNERIAVALSHTSWDLRIGNGKPGQSVSYTGKNGKEKIDYLRFGEPGGIEPLVIFREFHGAMPDYIEISEEFRHFHNLYHDRQADKFVAIDEDGDIEDVIIIEPKCIKIRLQYLKQFLAIKDMHLAIFFDRFAYSDKRLEDHGLTKISEDVSGALLKAHRHVDNFDFGSKEEQKSISRVVGKKLIPGVSKEKSRFWPHQDEKKYEEFIIGLDQDGRPLSHSCEESKLSNYFGANPGAPRDVTPVFFRREVLGKYYSNPKKFSVEDGYLRCGSLWGLRMDNNHKQYVVVLLSDLGDLSHKEQLYWKSYNVAPDGEMSSVSYKRNFLSEFTDPDSADLRFKMKFESFNINWLKAVGWPLFKLLAAADEHFYTSLRVPLTDDPAELDTQALSLSKVLIDSLNEEELCNRISDLPKDAKGIMKLEVYLREQGFVDYAPRMKFLRNLFDLRNGAGHRKGVKYERAAVVFRVNELKPNQCFETVLEGAIEVLDYLSQRLPSSR